jgi:tRNA-Thr(GGU) m(6)t(6)A37 methyltransferase TsaA
MQAITMTPIGVVHSTRKALEDDNWLREQASIELDASQFTAEALAGLTDFSHVEIIFHMDRGDQAAVERAARPPRDNPAWPRVGIFAQRGKDRPNHIGITVCRLKQVNGTTLIVEGLDAIDGTPVLDIKPWVEEFAPRGATHQPTWVAELMHGYWESSDS